MFPVVQLLAVNYHASTVLQYLLRNLIADNDLTTTTMLTLSKT
jgi:hypothetical protein